jgi:hypothetical protein
MQSVCKQTHLEEHAVGAIEGNLDGDVGTIFDTLDASLSNVEGNAVVSGVVLSGPVADELLIGLRAEVFERVGVGDSGDGDRS